MARKGHTEEQIPQALLKLFDRMTKPDQRLLLNMARKMAATGRPGSVTRAKE